VRKATYPGVPSAIMLTPDEAVALGRAVVADGRLKQLREDLGITRSAMAELLHTNLVTYAEWERRPEVRLRAATAQRVGRFFFMAEEELKLLQEAGIHNMIPFHIVATKLGIPQELLLAWYREERFKAVDAGILGLWVREMDVARLRRRR
jgi:transcriptional regulator with XRE-family HTH domain